MYAIFVRIWQPCRVWSFVCKVFVEERTEVFRWPFFIYRSSQQQMLFQVAACNMLIIITSPLHRLCRRSLFCTAAMQVFLPVFLVFAVRVIKIWNHKNRNWPWTAVFI